jgi:hypothetical protein
VPYYLDVGTGESDFTWQAMTGLGYSWKSVDVNAAWRYLDYDVGDSKPLFRKLAGSDCWCRSRSAGSARP